MAGSFKAYDIRGVVGRDVTEERARWIGRGLAETLYGTGGPVVVSRDMRTHSPQLAAALTRGLREGGCDVLDIGLAPTPMNYWAINHYVAAGGVTVTASHNPAPYNGFKVSAAGAAPVDYGTGLARVEAFVAEAEAGVEPPERPHGRFHEVSGALDAYLNWMDGFVVSPAAGRRPRIGVDAANGMAGLFLPRLATRYPWLDLVPLYWELDGTFPNHEADPLRPENLEPVSELVRTHGCDFGAAFDGDADRFVVVDEHGVAVSSDLLTGLIAVEMLERFPGSAVGYDLRSSRAVPEWIAEHGGEPVRGRVGHTFMKRLIKERGACFAGELSGHYYFAECFHTDSALMAMVQLLRLLDKSGQPLSELVAPLRRYAATGEVNFHVDDVSAALRRVEEFARSLGAPVDRLDGLSADAGEWWFNVRPSNTEPLLRLNLEARDVPTRDAAARQMERVIGALPA